MRESAREAEAGGTPALVSGEGNQSPDCATCTDGPASTRSISAPVVCGCYLQIESVPPNEGNERWGARLSNSATREQAREVTRSSS